MVAMMSINGLSMGSEGWIGTAATLTCGGLLVLSAYRNWAILWNWFGRFLRSSLGEKSARIALGVIGTAFALGGLFGSMTR